MKVETIGVVGAGQMGNGIAHVAALAGFRVVLHDIEEAFVRRGLSAVGDNMKRAVDKGRLSESDRQDALGRIRGTT